MATVKLLLKNSPKIVLVDDHVYEFLTTDKRLSELNIAENLREHSSGAAVFQKTHKKKDGSGYDTETIYLHVLIANKYLSKEDRGNKKLVSSINGNRLDCRIENLMWNNLSDIKRSQKITPTRNKTGYRGVSKDRDKFRAMIFKDRKAINLGLYDDPKKAAIAYNKMCWKLFEDERFLNKIEGVPLEEFKVINPGDIQPKSKRGRKPGSKNKVKRTPAGGKKRGRKKKVDKLAEENLKMKEELERLRAMLDKSEK